MAKIVVLKNVIKDFQLLDFQLILCVVHFTQLLLCVRGVMHSEFKKQCISILYFTIFEIFFAPV